MQLGREVAYHVGVRMKRKGDAPTGIQQPQEIARAKLKAVMDHTSTGVAIYRVVGDGEDFIIVEFNRAAQEIDKIGRAEVIGRSVLEAFPGVKEFGLFDVFQQVWRTGKPQTHPVSIYKDSRICGWRQNYVCKLPNGQIMAVYNDVTATKQSELASRMSEQRFRAIANYTYDWEVWVGPTGRILWTNPAATRISGYAVDELLVMPDYPGPLVYEPDRERLMGAFRSAVEGSTGSEQFRIKHKDGHILWAGMSWQPIYDEKGNALGHRESIRDVTARRLAEQAAELAEQEKEAILDSMVEQVIHLDADGSILWANQAACDAIGQTRGQIVGRLCEDVHIDWHEPWGSCPAARAMELGRPIRAEKSSPEGRAWFIQAAPVRDRGGGIIGGVEVAMDVTRYKRIEEALRQLRREFHELAVRIEADHPAAGGS